MYASSLIETVSCHLLRMPVRNGDNDLYHDRTAGEGMGRAPQTNAGARWVVIHVAVRLSRINQHA